MRKKSRGARGASGAGHNGEAHEPQSGEGFTSLPFARWHAVRGTPTPNAEHAVIGQRADRGNNSRRSGAVAPHQWQGHTRNADREGGPGQTWADAGLARRRPVSAKTSDAAAPERRWPSTIAEETVGTRLRTTADARHRCLACRDPRNQSPGSATRASERPQRPQGRGEAACARGEGPWTATAGGLAVQRAGHEKKSETPRCPTKIHNACVREASRKAACARRGGQRTATAGGLPVRRDGQEKESETPRCQAKGLARPQGRGRTRALTAGAMGSGVGQRNGVASADASVATADRVAFPRVCCPRLRPSSPADSPSSSRYPSPALRVMLR